ncbi:MAG: nucleotidyltransferase domain-containing protein [Candidatus Korarchaeota archaeon]|nr:nucleotidyltransferase domain-containing protein [Candidatus Korarchaeota archaeon]
MLGTEIKYLSRVIKDIIVNTARSEGVEVKKIILFGSRARGNYREDSDWDLLIIVSDLPDRRIIRKLQYEVYRKLSQNRVYCDVIVVNEEYYTKHKNVVGSIAYYAQLEGRPIE